MTGGLPAFWNVMFINKTLERNVLLISIVPIAHKYSNELSLLLSPIETKTRGYLPFHHCLFDLGLHVGSKESTLGGE